MSALPTCIRKLSRGPYKARHVDTSVHTRARKHARADGGRRACFGLLLCVTTTHTTMPMPTQQQRSRTMSNIMAKPSPVLGAGVGAAVAMKAAAWFAAWLAA